MLEMKITVAAPDLAVAINNLALALNASVTKDGTAFIIPAGVGEAVTTPKVEKPNTGEQAPVNPTMPAPGAPLSATPAQTATSIAPTVPVATPAPSVTPAANAPVAQQPVAPTVPTGAPTYTLEMIARAGTALVDAGKMDALCNLLAKYQVEALTALAPAQYGAFATDLRSLGAQI